MTLNSTENLCSIVSTVSVGRIRQLRIETNYVKSLLESRVLLTGKILMYGLIYSCLTLCGFSFSTIRQGRLREKCLLSQSFLVRFSFNQHDTWVWIQSTIRKGRLREKRSSWDFTWADLSISLTYSLIVLRFNSKTTGMK